MEQSVEKIIERNLLEVFNARDADSSRAAIDELWDKYGVFIDPGCVHEGVEKINAIVQLLFTQFEDYVFAWTKVQMRDIHKSASITVQTRRHRELSEPGRTGGDRGWPVCSETVRASLR